MQTLILGLGRSGRGLHLPVVLRARTAAASRHLFDDQPVVTFDRCGAGSAPPGTVSAKSLAQAANLTDPARTVVHVCTPPTERVGVLAEVGRLGFRKVLVEKPLAIDSGDLAQITRLRRRWHLDLHVVAPWHASALTRRLEEAVRDGELGALRAISVVQRKPRFTRSLAGTGHQSVFDVETPHAAGLALALAGSARVRDAAWTDLRMDDVVVPRMGTGWLSLTHDSGVRTELLSDLTSPTRERRVNLQLEGGSLVGHYPCSEDDHSAQLTVTAAGRQDRAVLHDDALSAFVVQAYERFATSASGAGQAALDAEVVRVLDEAKRRCQGPKGPRVLPRTPAAQQRPDRAAVTASTTARSRASGHHETGGHRDAASLDAHNGRASTSGNPSP